MTIINNYHSINKNVGQAKQCLRALGSSWRGDWSWFDGRTLVDQLEEINSVLDGIITYKQFCERNGIHPKQRCWNEHAKEVKPC